jgi:Helix-turn-helix domain
MAQIVVLKRAHFFSLDNDIIDVHAPTIGAIGVAIYTTLARYANRQTGECWPAIARIARTLDLARSTVKTYLRKLEAAGLIAITARQDAAGDPTSNGYTMLDPSPAVVDKRLAARKVATASEGGRPPAAPPPVACRPTGGSPADPKPSSPEHKEENQTESARAEEPPKTAAGNPCVHPIEQLSHFGEITVCQHCWRLLDQQADTTPGHPAQGEEGQAHAACAA